MLGGMTSADFGGDVVERVKAAKAAGEAAQAAKLEQIRQAMAADAQAAQTLANAVAAKEQAQAQAVEQARIAADEQREKTLAWVAWQRAGGTVADFEQSWPEMRRRQIAERVTAHDKALQVATANHYRQIF